MRCTTLFVHRYTAGTRIFFVIVTNTPQKQPRDDESAGRGSPRLSRASVNAAFLRLLFFVPHPASYQNITGTLRENATTASFNAENRSISSLVRDVVSALDFLHEHGIVHCDVKPENILLQANNKGGYTPKLTDFGGAMGERLGKRFGVLRLGFPARKHVVTRCFGIFCAYDRRFANVRVQSPSDGTPPGGFTSHSPNHWLSHLGRACHSLHTLSHIFCFVSSLCCGPWLGDV